MKTGVAAIFVGVLVALVVAGCGGGGDDSLTKAEFIEQGDAICAAASKQKNTALERELNKQAKTGKAFAKSAEEELVTDTALPPIAAMTEKLAALDAPDADAEAIPQAFEEAVQELEADPASGLGAGAAPFADADKLARAYGLKVCSTI